MALCDMFTLLFPAPGLLYMYTFGNHYKPLTPLLAYAWISLNEVNKTNYNIERKCNKFHFEFY